MQTYKQRQRTKRAMEEVEAEVSVPTSPLATTDSADELLARMEELLDESR